MVRDQKMEMSDSEIITLLGEFSFKDKEMSEMLKKIESRDFESVLKFIEDTRNAKNGPGIQNAEDARLRAEKQRKEIAIEAERQSMYRERIMSKIKANREEQLRKEKVEMNMQGSSEKIIAIDSDIKIKALINGSDNLILGFDKDATVNDLFNKLMNQLKAKSVTITRFGHSQEISKSDTLIIDQFKAKSFMIGVSFQ